MPGYVWSVQIRQTPRNGTRETITMSSAFPVGGYSRIVLTSVKVTYVDKVDEAETLNREATATHFGALADVLLAFEVSDMTHYRTVAKIASRAKHHFWTTELSLDGGITFREVVMRRGPSPVPFRGKTPAGATFEIMFRTTQPIVDYVPIESGGGW